MTGQNTDLSIADVEFLQAVRYIESNPEEFGLDNDTEQKGATTKALRDVLEKQWSTSADWSKGMISYRMNGPDKSAGGRGWGSEQGFGLVRLHDATMTPKGWTSRSVELTQKGEKWLSRKEEQMNMARSSNEGQGMSEVDSSATQLEMELQTLEEQVETLREENKELRQTVDELSDVVTRFQKSETGALDSDVADRLQEVLNRMVRQNRINRRVLGVNTEPFSPPGEASESDVVTAQQQLAETVLHYQGDN